MTLSKKELGKLIKEARKLKAKKTGGKFTQEDLADEVNRSRSYIGDIETGRTYPSYPLLSEIAKACDVPLSFFQVDIDRYVEDNMKGRTQDEIDAVKHVYKNDDSIKLDFLSGDEKDQLKVHDSEETYKAIRFTIIPTEFTNPEEAREYVDRHQIFGSDGFDTDKLDDNEILEFANALLEQMKMVSYKYRK